VDHVTWRVVLRSPICHHCTSSQSWSRDFACVQELSTKAGAPPPLSPEKKPLASTVFLGRCMRLHAGDHARRQAGKGLCSAACTQACPSLMPLPDPGLIVHGLIWSELTDITRLRHTPHTRAHSMCERGACACACVPIAALVSGGSSR